MIVSLSKLRFRKALLYGWIVVLALLLMASRYVWFIEIEGCDKLQETEVLTYLSSNGVAVGSKARVFHSPRAGRGCCNGALPFWCNCWPGT